MSALRSVCMAFLVFIVSAVTTGCGGESEDIDDVTKQTVLVYMPWSGDTRYDGLYKSLLVNLDSIESAIRKNEGLDDSRVLIFISETANSSRLYELTYNEDAYKCSRKTLKEYSGHEYTTAAGITTILNDMKSMAPALNYAMMVGCHGTGWTFTDCWDDYPNHGKQATTSDFGYAAPRMNVNQADPANPGFSIEGWPLTRFYGSVTDMSFATDIPTLAEGIEAAGVKFQFIMFDDCYMANVEVAYELRNVTNYLIASTSEVMAIGFPYQTMWASLAKPTPNYSSAVNAFINFYKKYAWPYGSVAAINCRNIEELASVMKTINEKYTFDESLIDSLQVLDGFHEGMFYDFGDYASRLCPERALSNRLESALNSVVASKASTDSIYSNLYSRPVFVKVNNFSGITISDPSQSPVAQKGIKRTSWYKATH